MSIKVFEVGQMACEDIQAWVGSAKFNNGTAYAAVNDGAFVVLDGLAPNTVYGASNLDWNVYKAVAPAAATLNVEDGIYVYDITAVTEGVIAGNNYKVGIKQVDLSLKAEYAGRIRKLAHHDRFWLGEGNFASAVGSNGYANLTAGSVLLTPAENKTANQLNIRILDSRDLSLGATATGEKEYLCEVL